MTRARSDLVPEGISGTFHCISRCVRRGWLCGVDPYTRRNYDHRKDWVVERLRVLSEAFSVSVLAYAAMSNHLHVVMTIDPDNAGEWTPEEVARRWCIAFPRSGNPTQIDMAREHIRATPELVERYRSRLSNISWFMRCLNEWIARRANAEDEVTGRFWEGRFKIQVLGDQQSALAAMAYVDLNPIRAGAATDPDSSLHTSVHARAVQLRNSPQAGRDLMRPIFGCAQPLMPISTSDYVALVAETGRNWRSETPGNMSDRLLLRLHCLGLNARQWHMKVQAAGNRRIGILATPEAILARAAAIGKRWVCGLGLSRRIEDAATSPRAAAFQA